MGYVLLTLPAVLLVLLGIAVVRAMMIKAPAPAVCDTVITDEECSIAAEKLGAMVRVPSVSKREDEDLSEFFKLHAVLEEENPGICRDLVLSYSRYNQHLSPGALLVEVGAAGNTLDEALTAAGALAQGIITLFQCQ